MHCDFDSGNSIGRFGGEVFFEHPEQGLLQKTTKSGRTQSNLQQCTNVFQ